MYNILCINRTKKSFHVTIYKQARIWSKVRTEQELKRTEQDEQLKYYSKLYINRECCVESMFHEYS